MVPTRVFLRRIGGPGLTFIVGAAVGFFVVAFGAGADDAGAIGAKVVRVYDGDTIVVVVAGQEERVRLIGVDAPELRTNPHGQAEPEAAAAARAFLEELVGGEEVRLELGVRTRDRYGRLLAYVYRGTIFINYELLTSGFAVVYTVPPDVDHAEEFLAAEREAREDGRGLWAFK